MSSRIGPILQFTGSPVTNVTVMSLKFFSVLLQIRHDLQVRLVYGLRQVVAAGLGLTDIQEPALSFLAQVLEQPRGCVDDPLVGVALVLLEARIIVHEQAAVLAERQLPFNDLGNARHEALHFGLLGTLDFDGFISGYFLPGTNHLVVLINPCERARDEKAEDGNSDTPSHELRGRTGRLQA